MIKNDEISWFSAFVVSLTIIAVLIMGVLNFTHKDNLKKRNDLLHNNSEKLKFNRILTHYSGGEILNKYIINNEIDTKGGLSGFHTKENGFIYLSGEILIEKINEKGHR